MTKIKYWKPKWGKPVKVECIRTNRKSVQTFAFPIPRDMRSKSVGVWFRELKNA